MLSNLTYKVVTYGSMSRLVADDAVNWASEMLDLEYSAPTLYILASIEKGTPFYEVEPYLKQSITELGLDQKRGVDALISNCRFYVNEIAEQRSIRTNVKTLCDICIEEDYADDIYDFYRLNFAWSDYEHDSNYPFNHYWEGANAKNIGRICIEEAEKWLEKYEHRYEQIIR